MILGDLLDARVLDGDGAAVGHVIDVRLELAVDADGAAGAATVLGLLVSPRRAGSFVGYERREVRSPWLIAALVQRRHRGTFLVPWEDVGAIDDAGVHLIADHRRESPDLG